MISFIQPYKLIAKYRLIANPEHYFLLFDFGFPGIYRCIQITNDGYVIGGSFDVEMPRIKE